MTCISCRAVQQHGNLQLSVLSTTLWRWETLLHTNCAHSPGTERRMVTITPTLQFNHALILLQALKLPAVHRKQQAERDDRELHNNDTHTHTHVAHNFPAIKNMLKIKNLFNLSFLYQFSSLLLSVLCEVSRYKSAFIIIQIYCSRSF